LEEARIQVLRMPRKHPMALEHIQAIELDHNAHLFQLEAMR
jgi:hypothetical protein